MQQCNKYDTEFFDLYILNELKIFNKVVYELMLFSSLLSLIRFMSIAVLLLVVLSVSFCFFDVDVLAHSRINTSAR